jgi:hypothetical protein
MNSIRLLALMALFGLLAACSHDAQRENPLDPELTPAVTLRVALDDTTGAATLSWTRHAGDQPFAAYLVLRNIANSTLTDTLKEITDADSTGFIDSSLAFQTSYQYRIAVVNVDGFAAQSSFVQIESLRPSTSALFIAQPDVKTGAITLTWNRYNGPGFSGYRIHRREIGTDQDSVLAYKSTVDDTLFVDLSATHETAYAYALIVQISGQDFPAVRVDARLSLQGSDITSLEFSSRTATANLQWQRYAGPRFARYEVRRRTPSAAIQIVHVALHPDSVAWADVGLSGTTEYTYAVDVITEQSERVNSRERTGQFHELLASWELPDVDGEFVRLYNEPGTGIIALSSSANRIRLLSYSDDGALIKTTVVDEPLLDIQPRTVAMARHEDGSRSVALKSGHAAGLLRLDPAGALVIRKDSLFADGLAPMVDFREYGTKGTATLGGRFYSQRAEVAIESASIWSDGMLVRADNFGGSSALGDVVTTGDHHWSMANDAAILSESYILIPGLRDLFGDPVSSRLYVTVLTPLEVLSSTAVGARSSWDNMSVVSRSILGIDSAVGIRIGTVPFGGVSNLVNVVLDATTQEAQLKWILSDLTRDRSAGGTQSFEFNEPMPILQGLVYELDLAPTDSPPVRQLPPPCCGAQAQTMTIGGRWLWCQHAWVIQAWHWHWQTLASPSTQTVVKPTAYSWAT